MAVGYLGQMKVKHGNEEQEVYLDISGRSPQDFEEMTVFRDHRNLIHKYDLETEGNPYRRQRNFWK